MIDQIVDQIVDVKKGVDSVDSRRVGETKSFDPERTYTT